MIISSISLKGGAGKTTLSINLAVELSKRKHKVLLIDSDPHNQNCVKWASIRSEELPLVTTISMPDPEALRKSINSFIGQYNFIVIDGTPAMEEITGTLMMISDLNLIPIKTGTFDVWSFNDQFLPKYQQIKNIKFDCNGESILDCRILLNCYKNNEILSRQVCKLMGKYDIPVLNAKIGNRTSFAYSPMHGIGVSEYTDNKAKNEIRKLTNEVESIIQSKELALCH